MKKKIAKCEIINFNKIVNPLKKKTNSTLREKNAYFYPQQKITNTKMTEDPKAPKKHMDASRMVSEHNIFSS